MEAVVLFRMTSEGCGLGSYLNFRNHIFCEFSCSKLNNILKIAPKKTTFLLKSLIFAKREPCDTKNMLQFKKTKGFLGKNSSFFGKKLKHFGFKTQRYGSDQLHSLP